MTAAPRPPIAQRADGPPDTASAALLEGAVRSARTGIVLTDGGGLIARVNPAAATLLGVQPSAVCGRSAREVLATRLAVRFADPGAWSRAMVAVLDDPALELEHDARMADGRVLHHISCPVRAADGAPLGRLEVFSDVTEMRAALAAARRLAAAEHHVADVLQRALANADLPAVRGLEVATVYRPADGVQVGGDISASWAHPGGGLITLMGDVSGRGIAAAGLATMVRHMAEALSRHHPGPGALATELNDLLHRRLPDGSLVTLSLVMVDPAHGELSWTTAGHPPPVLLRASGEVVTLAEPGPPCGAFAGERFDERRTAFGVGDLLVLYTDGVTEARRSGREFGEHALHELLGTLAHLPTAALPHSVLAAVTDWCDGTPTDDVAITAVRNVGGAGSPL